MIRISRWCVVWMPTLAELEEYEQHDAACELLRRLLRNLSDEVMRGLKC